ncbi:type II toxin-antitoxin system RelE/ParE family toxin [Dyadobacter chenwenxiniae]|uniref:Type II toxin-antitoxin system RelE/ParE family toxin n=1 Tax=Dyadobacter chenwenxiniae TaxID=2906456 RepID=A0A9X1PSF9_9BACT|nr:type II toxin-antitoxin system RelE/ParE family toxin [Dyadobacter chenwenxiniae]MCF0050126.1 type II toxin-antitoxin system RelE/ParE family toxin [Dyadobacter chenwenxiniae]MCF0064833.1 type II toxin-antitoxin system RelE/ParE family toxin [Dyadobacter chenwenxiniae]UON82957.1 type II toxin-antitoxin system RelE/ParE family toxin [Dyadobacter chenwenxiniae]
MSYKIIASKDFEKDLKRLVKKYASLAQETTDLIKSIANNPVQGKPIGKDCFKIRLAIKSKGRGKSGGARIITCVFTFQEEVVLLTIYDKAEKENIKAKELDDLLNAIGRNY